MKIRCHSINGVREIKILLNHPMENGRNRDPLSGELIPAHFITELYILLNDSPVITASLGPSMSKDPFFIFHMKNGQAGDILNVRWIDNRGNIESGEYRLE